MNELQKTLQQLSLEQHALALAFLLCYGSAIGSMLGPTGRLRAAGMALVTGLLFTAMTRPWAHGALLMLFAVAIVGAFIAAAWSFSAFSASSGGRALRQRLAGVVDAQARAGRDSIPPPAETPPLPVPHDRRVRPV
jgi:hypothetical protein